MLNIGYMGEFRAVVSNSKGDVIKDTGYQKNLLLNTALEFLAGGLEGDSLNFNCVIGAGSSEPVVTQTALDSFIAIADDKTEITKKTNFENRPDNKHVTWEQAKYRFTDLNNVNISEVGLVCFGATQSNIILTTRALIKNAEGMPTTITVLSGEILDIYYKVYRVIDTSSVTHVVNMLDGDGGAVPYNVEVRPLSLGASGIQVTEKISAPSLIAISNQELVAVNASGDANLNSVTTVSLTPYVMGSYKRGMVISISLDAVTSPIRQINTFQWNYAVFFPFQVRFGAVADDAMIPKTSQHTLSLPFEYVFTRYGGEL